jgi:hypothetical protein
MKQHGTPPVPINILASVSKRNIFLKGLPSWMLMEVSQVTVIFWFVDKPRLQQISPLSGPFMKQH